MHLLITQLYDKYIGGQLTKPLNSFRDSSSAGVAEKVVSPCNAQRDKHNFAPFPIKYRYSIMNNKNKYLNLI